MRCERARRLLIMEGTATWGATAGRRLRRHLADCPCCREEVGRMAGEERLIRAAYARLPIPPDFTRQVWARIR